MDMKYTYQYIQQMEFLCHTQPLSLLARTALTAELMWLWPCPPVDCGTVASPVVTETSIVVHSPKAL